MLSWLAISALSQPCKSNSTICCSRGPSRTDCSITVPPGFYFFVPALRTVGLGCSNPHSTRNAIPLTGAVLRANTNFHRYLRGFLRASRMQSFTLGQRFCLPLAGGRKCTCGYQRCMDSGENETRSALILNLGSPRTIRNAETQRPGTRQRLLPGPTNNHCSSANSGKYPRRKFLIYRKDLNYLHDSCLNAVKRRLKPRVRRQFPQPSR